MCKTNYFSIAATALLSLTSCQALIKENRILCTAPVHVSVSGFSVSQEAFPDTKAVTNVPFKRNCVTVLTGAMYTNSSVGGSFQVETEWIADHNGTF